MGNEASSPSKRSSSKKKQGDRPSSVEGVILSPGSGTCTQAVHPEKKNGHSKVLSTELDINELNTELKKVPDNFVNEQNKMSNETMMKSNGGENSESRISTNNNATSHHKSNITTQSHVTVEDDSDSKRNSKGCKTLRELAESASKTHKESSQEDNNDLNESNTQQTETVESDRKETNQPGNDVIGQNEVCDRSTELPQTPPTVNNTDSEKGENNSKQKSKDSKKNKDKKQKSESKLKNVDKSVGDVSKSQKESKKSKKSEKTKSPKNSEKTKCGSISLGDGTDVRVSSDMKRSSESVVSDLTSEQEVSNSSINVSSTSISRSSVSIDQMGSGKKEKKKGKNSENRSSTGSTDVKVKKRKKKSPTGTGSKDLPALEPQSEKRRSIFDDDFIVEAGLGDDNLEVVSLSSLSSVGDSEERTKVNSVSNNTDPDSPNVTQVQELLVSEEMKLVTNDNTKNLCGHLQEYLLNSSDTSKVETAGKKYQRTHLNFHRDQKMFNGSKLTSLIMRQNSDITYNSEPSKRVILTRPLSFEGPTSKAGWKSRPSSFSDMVKRTTAVLSPPYRKRKESVPTSCVQPTREQFTSKERETGKEQHPDSTIGEFYNLRLGDSTSDCHQNDCSLCIQFDIDTCGIHNQWLLAHQEVKLCDQTAMTNQKCPKAII